VIALLEFDAPKHDSTLKKIRVAFPAMKIRDETAKIELKPARRRSLIL